MNNNNSDTTDALADSTGPQKSPTVRIRAIPDAGQSIQANFCKTPSCDNFGVPPRLGPIQMGRGKANDNYAIVSKGSASQIQNPGSETVGYSNSENPSTMRRASIVKTVDNIDS